MTAADRVEQLVTAMGNPMMRAAREEAGKVGGTLPAGIPKQWVVEMIEAAERDAVRTVKT